MADEGHQRPRSEKSEKVILSIIIIQFMLKKPSLSLKKVVKPKRLMKTIKGHEVKKVKQSFYQSLLIKHFINHYYSIFAQEAFPQPEKSSKAQKADEDRQRPQSEKVKKSYLINHCCLIFALIAFMKKKTEFLNSKLHVQGAMGRKK